MSGIWILIFVIAMDRGGGPATAEFANKLSCESAVQKITAAMRGAGGPFSQARPTWAVCVQKDADHQP